MEEAAAEWTLESDTERIQGRRAENECFCFYSMTFVFASFVFV